MSARWISRPMDQFSSLGTLKSVIEGLPWPVDFFSSDKADDEGLPDFLDQIFVLDYEGLVLNNGYQLSVSLGFQEELSISIPGLGSTALVFGDVVSGYTLVN